MYARYHIAIRFDTPHYLNEGHAQHDGQPNQVTEKNNERE
jgi:hypothetical protein